MPSPARRPRRPRRPQTPTRSYTAIADVAESVTPVPAAPEHSLTGEFRVHECFHSEHLAHDRDILVFLPPGFDAAAGRRYPVLYMHDGQNLFDRATAFGGAEWQVDETAHRLIEEGAIEPLIIVGIYNTGAHRVEEYTPVPDAEHPEGGKADDYGRMLVEELKPFIDATYPSRPDAASTGLAGSSLGGLVTMHLALRHPEVFGRLAILSPSVWWGDRAIVREVEALPAKTATRIWLDVGAKEGEQVAADARTLCAALVAKGWVEGEDLAYREVPDGEHNERSWAARIADVLQFLYPVAGGSP